MLLMGFRICDKRHVDLDDNQKFNEADEIKF